MKLSRRKNLIPNFEKQLTAELSKFNYRYFPSPEYKRKIREGKINEEQYAKEKEREFLKIYDTILKEYGIKIHQDNNNTFLINGFYLQ